MNKVILMGRLTRDPEIRNSGDPQKAVARYTLAVDRRTRRDGENTADFFNCVVFGRGAEFAEKYLHKGTKILATGRIQTGSYTNRDGQRVNTVDIMVEEQEFAESKNSSAGFEGNSGSGSGFGGGNSGFGGGSNSGSGFGGSSNSGFGGGASGFGGSRGGSSQGYSSRGGAGRSGGDGFMEIPEGLEDELPFN